jgi:hypothetical protein
MGAGGGVGPRFHHGVMSPWATTGPALVLSDDGLAEFLEIVTERVDVPSDGAAGPCERGRCRDQSAGPVAGGNVLKARDIPEMA